MSEQQPIHVAEEPISTTQLDPSAKVGLEERLMGQSSGQLTDALLQLQTGLATEEELRHARASLSMFGSSLERYCGSRLGSMSEGGDTLNDLGQVTEELVARTEIIYRSVIEQAGDTSTVRETIEKMRSNRLGRLAGRIAIAGAAGIAGWGASRGLDFGVQHLSFMATSIDVGWRYVDQERWKVRKENSR